MAAKVGYNPSLIWHSIWSSRDLINDGLLWRIGSGKSVNIWSDKWLSIPTIFQVQFQDKMLDQDAKVQKLINFESYTWKRDLIYQILSREEDDTICSIPLSLLGAMNKLTWWPT